jgi:hypothetical protein
MGGEIASQAEHFRQLGRRSVRKVERIDDVETVRVAQGGVQSGSSN